MTRVETRPFSAVAFLTLRTARVTKRLVAKTAIHHPANQHVFGERNQAVVEYDILRKLHTGLETVEGCFVPRPLVVVPEIETYVMEYVEGDLFVDLLKQVRYFAPRAGLRCLQRHFFLCGRWLKHFQSITGVSVANTDVLQKTIEGCERLLKQIEQTANGHCPSCLRNRVMGDLEENMNRLSGDELLVAGRHGDFGPWNMIVNDRGITVIDFLGYDQDLVALDVLKILVCLDKETRSLTSSPKRVASLRTRFLEGYGELPAVPEAVLQICETRQHLSLLANCFRFKPRQLHRCFEYRRIARAQINWLSSGSNRRLLWPGK